MTLRELTPKEYGDLFQSVPHVFNSVGFTELNRYKCDDVRYLCFSDTRVRGAIILGLRDGMWHSPFSAPFGGFTLTRPQGIGSIYDMVDTLHDYASASGAGLRVTLPPSWHDEALHARCVSALSRRPGVETVIDVSYHLPLQSVDVMDMASGNYRNHLRQALAHPFEVARLPLTPGSVERVYRVIKLNHDQRGFPLRMSLPDMTATAELMDADLFVLSLDGRDVAGAIVFVTAPGVAQVIVWGDVVECHGLRSMNRLAYEVASYYRDRGMRVLDIGPSTVEGEPNFGLCAFKESMGCRPSLKYTFVLPPL